MPSKKKRSAYKAFLSPLSPDSPDVRKSRRLDKVVSRCFHKDTCIGKYKDACEISIYLSISYIYQSHQCIISMYLIYLSNISIYHIYSHGQKKRHPLNFVFFINIILMITNLAIVLL